MGESLTGAWWRRNALALLTLLVLVPVGVVAIDALEFGVVRNAERTVAAGATTEIADWSFGPAAVEPLDAAAIPVPRGTSPVMVTVRVDRGHRTLSCLPLTVIEASSGRSWTSVTTLDVELPTDSQTACTSRTGIPYDLVAVILLPDDVTGDLVVELSTTSVQSGGLDLRFDVDR
jgi:hypothetical protein